VARAKSRFVAGHLAQDRQEGRATATVDHPQALEQAIRYGWIDGQKRALTSTTGSKRFTPRGRAASGRRSNRDKALELIARSG